MRVGRYGAARCDSCQGEMGGIVRIRDDGGQSFTSSLATRIHGFAYARLSSHWQGLTLCPNGLPPCVYPTVGRRRHAVLAQSWHHQRGKVAAFDTLRPGQYFPFDLTAHRHGRVGIGWAG